MHCYEHRQRDFLPHRCWNRYARNDLVHLSQNASSWSCSSCLLKSSISISRMSLSPRTEIASTFGLRRLPHAKPSSNAKSDDGNGEKKKKMHAKKVYRLTTWRNPPKRYKAWHKRFTSQMNPPKRYRDLIEKSKTSNLFNTKI